MEKLQDVDNLNLTQFHGIEKAEFPALVAKTALKMAERKWSGKKTEPNIICADALEINWNAVVKSEKCTHIVGNPPFIGANTRTWAQSRQVIRIGKSGILDYAACWFVKAEQYMGNHVKTAFITTAGINRGAQVLPLWEPLFNKNMDIMFAWIPEYWNPDDAHIAVSIIGMMRNYAGKRRLFGLNTETNPKTITPYLIGMDKPMLVKETVKRKPLITMGAALWDYGHYVFNDDEMAEFISQEPLTRPYFRKFVGARDYMRGTCRNVLYLKNAPDNICNLPPVLARINMVRASRLGSRVKTNGLSPRMFLRDIPDKSYLFIPQVTSSNRSYLAVGWLNAGDYIPANCLLIPDPTLELFAMLCSKPHRIWLDVFGGKLNVDFRYNTSVYNTFPFPTKMAKVDDLAREIMAKRSNMAPEIAYNPDIMPVGLKKAHEALDVKVWKSYGLTAEPPDIIEFLITQYAKSRKNLDKKQQIRLVLRIILKNFIFNSKSTTVWVNCNMTTDAPYADVEK